MDSIKDPEITFGEKVGVRLVAKAFNNYELIID
jgi:hypothetical protein